MSRRTSFGAEAPATSTAPITTSALRTSVSMLSSVEASVRTRPSNSSSRNRSRGSERSMIDTSAPSSTAMRAA
jgi:hypothetical protein